MVLAKCHLQSCKENEQKPCSVQCSVSDLALYRLPSFIRPESIDFENSLMKWIKNNLDERNRNEDNDLFREMIHELTGDDVCSNLNIEQSNCLKEQHRIIVCIELNHLCWAWAKFMFNFDESKFNLSKSRASMQCCFTEIKLCYVNIQLPNIVIWLLSSIPQKVVKSETLIAKSNIHQTFNKSKCLYALVCQCFRENDVVNLRQVYKHLRLANKLTKLSESSRVNKIPISTTKLEHLKNQCKNYSELNIHSPNRMFNECDQPTNRPQIKQIQPRQRQPAKLIHENVLFGHSNTFEYKSDSSTLSHKKNLFNKIRKFTIQSESEFDTTQITNYLSQNSKLLKSSNKVRARSRSVDLPRQRSKMVFKPVDSEVQISIPLGQNDKYDSLDKFNKRYKNDKDKKSKGFLDSLNSEGSSISDESISNEYTTNSIEYENFNLSKLNVNTCPKNVTPIMIKSVLKKSTSYFEGEKKIVRLLPKSLHHLHDTKMPYDRLKFAKFEVSQCNLDAKSRQCATTTTSLNNKKNVTFSAYATIQVVDN